MPERHDKIPEGEELDVPRLARELTAQGIPTGRGADRRRAARRGGAASARPGDVLLVMSNGAFGGFIDKLLARLASR